MELECRRLIVRPVIGKADALRCARRNNNQPENRNNNVGFRVVRRSNQDQFMSVNKVVTHDAGHLRMPGRQSDHDRFPPVLVRQRANKAKQVRGRDALVLKMERESRLFF